MKKYILVIMAIAMMLVGVEVYAQPRGHRHGPAPRYHGYHRPYRPAPRPYYRPVYHPRYVLPYSYYRWYPTWGYYYYSPLSVYLYDSYESPTKIKVDCIEFKRTASSRLRIKNGTEPKFYLDMYMENHLRYTCPSGIKVDVQTEDGRAYITVYSKETTAEYTL